MNLQLRRALSGLLLLVMLLNLVPNDQDVVFASEVYDFGGGVTGKLEGDTLVVKKTGEGNGRMLDYKGYEGFRTPIYNVEGIKNIEIGSGVNIIGENSFHKSLDSRITGKLTIGQGVTQILNGAFYSNYIEELEIGSSVKFIGKNVFSSNRIKSVTIPDSVEAIYENSFYRNSIDFLEIGKNMRNIPDKAFAHNKLTQVTIPKGIKTIKKGAFDGNPLIQVNILSDVDTGLYFSTNGNFKLDYEDYGKREGIYNWNDESKKWEIEISKSSNTKLSGLTVDGNTIENFDENINDYTLSNTIGEQLTIGATTADENAIVAGDIGEKTLEDGLNIFKIIVTAEDGQIEEYTINVIREESIILEPSLPEQEIPENQKYMVSFNSNQGSLVETVEDLDLGSKLTVPELPIKDGFILEGWYKEEALMNEWDFEEDVVVESITLYAKWIEIEVPKSSESRLIDITINGITITDFDEDKTEYNLSKTNSDKIIISATTKDEKATISGDIGENNLAIGKNQFSVKVTAEDGISEKTYTLNISRKNPEVKESDNTNLNTEPDNSPDISYPINDNLLKLDYKGGEKEIAMQVVINNDVQILGKEMAKEEKGEKHVDLILHKKQVEEAIDNMQNKGNVINTLEILMTTQNADNIITYLDGDTVRKLAENKYNISIKTENIVYTVPGKDIEIEKIAGMLGIKDQSLEDIKLEIKINKLDADKIKEIEINARKNNYEIVSSPVEFKILAKTKLETGEEKQVEISKFNNYVDRILKISEGVAWNHISTGAIYNDCGTFSHIPTQILKKEDEYFAKLNSMTNSIYLVIENPITVDSVDNHWSKESVNSMVARLVIEDPKTFAPNEEITRGEFAEYITKAIGIYRTDVVKENAFSDVDEMDKLANAITIAVEYGIIKGFDDGTFRANEKITREQAMTMYSRSIDIVKLKVINNNRIEGYKDREEVSSWAYKSVEKTLNSGVFNGTSKYTISPKATFTYAEAATAIQNLLIESNLINK